MPKPRSRLVSLADTPYYHCIGRCVRRAFLCGTDVANGYSYEHRRQWIVDRMRELSSIFTVDLCAYAVMSNHYHLVVRIDTARVKTLSNEEVAERWLTLFKGPDLIHRWLAGVMLSRAERFAVDTIVALWRRRLSDLSWFMRCLNEFIARKANREDHCTGRFWEGRFKSQALLDERALLSCMAYVDLNPIRAAMARTPEGSDYTSVQERITQPDGKALLPFNDDDDAATCIPFGYVDYLELVDWAGRIVRDGKRGSIPESTPPIVRRLAMNQEPLLEYLANGHGQAVNALGPASRLRQMAANLGMKFLCGLSLGKQLFPEPG